MSELLASAGSERYGARTDEGGISADDPAAVDKLKAKLAGLEAFQEKMKAVNAYYRKHGTLEGCPQLSAEEVEKLKAGMARSWRADYKPYESYVLTNNNAVIRQTKKRIEELSAKAETEYEGWAFEGGEVKMNREINRLQVFFDAKPDRETCSAMRHSGFKLVPHGAPAKPSFRLCGERRSGEMCELSALAGSEGYEARDDEGAWQRQLTSNAIYAAKHLDCIRPLSGERPAPEQEGAVQGSAHNAADGWRFYIIADLKTWADNAPKPSELEHFDSFEAARARFEELRGQDYNSEAAEPGPDGQPSARLTLGLMSTNGMSAADILHVRRGENYLVTDFTRSEQLRDDPQVMDILAQVSREMGFDRVRVWEQVEVGRQMLSIIPFAEWDNPWFSSNTPGRLAAQYCALLRECYPNLPDGGQRGGQIAEIIKFVQQEGKRGADQMSLAVAGIGASFPGNARVQALASSLMAELARYDGPERDAAEKRKAPHKKSRER